MGKNEALCSTCRYHFITHAGSLCELVIQMGLTNPIEKWMRETQTDPKTEGRCPWWQHDDYELSTGNPHQPAAKRAADAQTTKAWRER